MTVFGYDGRANLILAVVLVDVGVHYNEEKKQKPTQPKNMGAGGLWNNNTSFAKNRYTLYTKSIHQHQFSPFSLLEVANFKTS